MSCPECPTSQPPWTKLYHATVDFLFAVCSCRAYLCGMTEDAYLAHFEREVERLAAENEALRQTGFRASKAEAMLAFEYDRIPIFLKTPSAIRAQRKVATTLLFVIPAMLVVVAIVGSINAYHDHEQSVEISKGLERVDAAFQRDPAFKPQK